MNKEGLLQEPQYDKPNIYLESGDRTQVTFMIQELANTATGDIEENLVRDLLVKMNTVTKRLDNAGDERKFKRTADEILESGERTGCCDSSTLFTALCRARRIPAMQVITINTIDARKRPNEFNSGHFFTLCYFKNSGNNGEWKLLDSDRGELDHREIRFLKFNPEDKNITRRFYAIAYARDYSDLKYKRTKN